MPSPAAEPPAPSSASAQALAQTIESFFTTWPGAAVLEDGRLLFDLRLARYSVSAEHGRCLLHLWSGERNLVRTIVASRSRRDTLLLESRRFGQTRPQTLTLLPDPDFRTPTARDTARRRYLRALEQALPRHFPGWTPASFRSAMDLEHSFGPAYARGLLTKGQSAWAVLGVGPEESSTTVEGALTLGILWLAHCREQAAGRRVVHGLKLIVPTGSAPVTQTRMAWLHPGLAQWELYECDPSSGTLTSCLLSDHGNSTFQLAHAFDPHAALDRCAVGVAHLRSLLPAGLLAASEIRPRSATAVAFSLHGLEYARVRHGLLPNSFTPHDEIVFGAGRNQTLLDDVTQDLFLDLMDQLFRSRYPGASGADALFRLQPERWLESILRRDLSVLDSAFDAAAVYSQVPAFSSGSRGLLDLLTLTRHGRLAILELKAEDDLHLPLQALDYWTRVRALHRAGDLTRHGYFPGAQLAPDDPLLFLIVPALHVHPANETVLRHLAPAVPWQLIALDEHWRQDCRVLLRKQPPPAPAEPRP